MIKEKTYQNFFVTEDSGKLAVKRMVITPDGSRCTERLAKSKYAHIRTREALQAFVDRLNGREHRRAISAIQLKLTYLPPNIMEDFRALLNAEIPSQKDAKLHYHNLHRYCLLFFQDTLRLNDPLDWKAHESQWGLALLGETPGLFEDEKKRSVKTIKGIVHTANRLLAYLHQRFPREISYIKLAPISKARLKNYGAQLKMSQKPIGKYISAADWAIIDEKLPDSIGAFVRLGYYYGLRRAESLALNLSDNRKDGLKVRRQLKAVTDGEPIFGPLKNRKERLAPHWFANATISYNLIKSALEHPMHPDTYGLLFSKFMKQLKMDYQLHDLRRTFITRALDINSSAKVMQAVGHSNTETTMRYIRDDGALDSDVFVPDEAK